MAKATTAEAKPNPFQRLQTFLREVRVELDKVTWPSKEDLQVSTKVTLFLLGAMATITFGFDKVFEIAVVTLLNLAS